MRYDAMVDADNGTLPYLCHLHGFFMPTSPRHADGATPLDICLMAAYACAIVPWLLLLLRR